MNFVCKICNTSNSRIINNISGHKLCRCFKCRAVFVEPQPDFESLRRKNNNKYSSIETEGVYFSMEKLFMNRAKRCIKVLSKFKKRGKLLDVGCSYGFYLKAFIQAKYQSKGIEISKRALKYAKKTLHLDVINDRLENHKFEKNEFDIVTLFDVLEHFSDPCSSIIKISNILKKKGIVVIQTPNYDSLMSKLTSEKWFWLLIPQHLFLYSVPTLRFFLNKYGFKVLKIYTWDDFRELINNILWKMNIKSVGKTKLLHKVLLKFLSYFYPISYFWNKFNLGGEIVVYAQKE